VQVRADVAEDMLELSVSNSGEVIPRATLVKLFQPFERGAVRPNQQGLGLGLYIASEIASAHGGALSVTSSDGRTCFTFRMPASRT
jgi:signal transduction histidine kinase